MNMTSYFSSPTIFVPKWLSDQESQFSEIKSLSILLMSEIYFRLLDNLLNMNKIHK